jgi:adenylyltransferase/sulfurtransferase
MLRTGCADGVRNQGEAGRVATTPISASIVGALQVQEAMKIIHLTPDEAAPFKTLQGKMLRYEGMTCTTSIYRFASWKNTCPAHEQWDDVNECPELSAQMTVGSVLQLLRQKFDCDFVEINMRNNKFIDVVVSDRPEREFRVMTPESQLDACIKADKDLRQLSYRTLIHKHFFENIGDRFPYQELTLQQIGIPPFDVIEVSTDKGVFHLELTADAALYE